MRGRRNRGQVCGFVAALATLLIWAGVASARPQTTQFGYHVSLRGSERLTWSLHRPSRCGQYESGEDGSGIQTVTFRTIKPGWEDTLIQGPDAGYIHTLIDTRVRETWTRRGSLVTHDCDDGDEPATTRACGSRVTTAHWGLQYIGGLQASAGSGEDKPPYDRLACPFSGYDPFLAVGVAGRIPLADEVHHRRFTIHLRAHGTERNELWGELSDDDGSKGSVTDTLTATFTPTRYQLP